MTVEQSNAKEEIMEILEKCTKCGLCKELCPVFKVLRQEDMSPRGHSILLSNKIFDKIVFDCTLCRLCEQKCPLDLKICDAIKKARQILNLKGKESQVGKEILQKIINRQNPYTT